MQVLDPLITDTISRLKTWKVVGPWCERRAYLGEQTVRPTAAFLHSA
jgi:hypothetical protein